MRIPVDADDPESAWSVDALRSAVAELRREFARIPADKLESAVERAAKVVAPSDRGVKLLQKARELLRRD